MSIHTSNDSSQAVNPYAYQPSDEEIKEGRESIQRAHDIDCLYRKIVLAYEEIGEEFTPENLSPRVLTQTLENVQNSIVRVMSEEDFLSTEKKAT